MPRDGATTFADLQDKLGALRVACDRCGRAGRYSVPRLVERRGRNAKVVDLLAEISADCPRWMAGGLNDGCRVHCPTLSTVL